MKSKFLIIFFAIILGFIYFFFEKRNGAVVLTIDDGYIDEWYQHLDYFDENDVKLTMYVTSYHTWNESQKRKLKEFEKRGHVVGFHSKNHIRLFEFLKKKSASEYIKSEIDEGMTDLLLDGFNINHFAYPFGEATKEIDSLLVKRFKTVRKLKWTSAANKLKDTDVFYSFPVLDKILFGAGIDVAYNVSDQELKEGLKKAYVEKKTLLLYCHRLDESGKPWTTSFKRIEQIVSFCKKHNMQMISLEKLVY